MLEKDNPKGSPGIPQHLVSSACNGIVAMGQNITINFLAFF